MARTNNNNEFQLHVYTALEFWFFKSFKLSSYELLESDSISWYPAMGAFVKNMTPSSVDLQLAMAAFAVLSQNKPFERNLELYHQLIEAPLTGGTTGEEVRKANALYWGKCDSSLTTEERIKMYATGGKISAFADNIIYGNESHLACIDTHMIDALVAPFALGNKHWLVQECFLEFKQNHNVPVTIAQALVWIKIRSEKLGYYDSGLQYITNDYIYIS
jgi:hypothetical protein